MWLIDNDLADEKDFFTELRDRQILLEDRQSGKISLRFSKTGERNIEEAYARHFVRLGKMAAQHGLNAENKVDCREKSAL